MQTNEWQQTRRTDYQKCLQLYFMAACAKPGIRKVHPKKCTQKSAPEKCTQKSAPRGKEKKERGKDRKERKESTQEGRNRRTEVFASGAPTQKSAPE